MPRRKGHQPQPKVQDYLDPSDLLLHHDEPEHEPEPEPEPEPESEPPRQSRQNIRNAHIRAPRPESSSPEPLENEPITLLGHPASPTRNHSLLSQLSFPTHTKSRPVNIREDITSTEKVSDQYTPPSDTGLPDDLYGKSPNSVAVSSPANTPPVEPAFSARHSFNARSPPLSPPQRIVRPVSFGGSIPPLPGHLRYPPSNYGSPPAPHLPQAHFYGAHDIDLGVPKLASRSKVQDVVFTKFVKLPTSAGSQEYGVVSGYEGRLNIYSFDGTSTEEVAALFNLPGTVVDAEILSWTSGPDPFAHLRPLITITSIHFDHDEGVTQYRSTVSVHSLSPQKLSLVLLQTSPEPLHQPLPGLMPNLLEPQNQFRLSSAGKFLTVASGKSGEVFVFSPVFHDTSPTFECLVKLWTSIQPQHQRRDSSHSRSAHRDSPSFGPGKIKADEHVPILALSARWLALCPPSSPLPQGRGAVLGNDVLVGRQAGLENMLAGSRPPINCDVDSPDADTLLGKFTRGVAQEMMKAGKWLGEQGALAWNNYWKKEDMSSSSFPQPPYANVVRGNQMPYNHFPPTHADAQQIQRDPELVSIYDLGSLRTQTGRKSVSVAPFATFQPPHGCSFLSFAPHGLFLMTASRKGDYQYIWNLLETKYTRMALLETEAEAQRFTPRVRQLARFDRLSSSVIVDAVWDLPTVSRVAILTKNKTVHIFDLPSSVMRWPPFRRPKKSRPISAPPDAVLSNEHDGPPAGGFFTSAMNLAGKTQPILANLRGRAPSTSTGLAGIGQAGIGLAAATGARGSKVVASGLSKSLGAASETVTRLQHAGDSRLSLKSEKEVVPGRLIWMRRSSKPGLCVLGDTGLKLYQVRKTKSPDSRLRDATVFEARRPTTFKLPDPTATTVQEPLGYDCTGFWRLKANPVTTSASIHPLSFAEIDTNAPFQPFHSDRRVTLSIFDNNAETLLPKVRSSKRNRSTAYDVWVFGDAIPTTRLCIHPEQIPEDYDPGSVIYRETTVSNDPDGTAEHIVSTTRRKKPKRGNMTLSYSQAAAYDADTVQEGFFEDDCDVLDFATDRV